MWKKKKEEKAQQSGDAFTTSVSDLMAGLLSIFILALCYFMLNFQTVTNKYTGNTELRNQLLKDVGKDLQAQGLQVRIDTKQGVLRIPESVLFESGEASIKEQGQAAVSKLSQSLLKTMTRPEYREALETVFIEGHTDNVPIHNEFFQSNWELSTQRAINTWNLMRNDVPEFNWLVNPRGEPIFSCSGYAETRPVRENGLDPNSEAGRAANRRIDIRFVMMPPQDPGEKPSGGSHG
ncbi:OmpA family protein [Acidaminococcus fermentans]|jgi:chemotaxis protein MotB|uniref:OmpA/MotB family protein n=1 Tax=Acidaminococcus TaxID=904 RepID=UPI00033EAD2E|nr:MULTISPECIES: OmpA family protein [Acidaminococcus]MEE1597334.1 OmpA family protein [Acidaminococcus fermentans]MEE4121599.1 OmpA family protein [Acidaminococcus fermentans]CDE94533.1 ompA/MotB domain protein [Acidaminococcus sp. CAG:542]